MDSCAPGRLRSSSPSSAAGWGTPDPRRSGPPQCVWIRLCRWRECPHAPARSDAARHPVPGRAATVRTPRRRRPVGHAASRGSPGHAGPGRLRRLRGLRDLPRGGRRRPPEDDAREDRRRQPGRRHPLPVMPRPRSGARRRGRQEQDQEPEDAEGGRAGGDLPVLPRARRALRKAFGQRNRVRHLHLVPPEAQGVAHALGPHADAGRIADLLVLPQSSSSPPGRSWPRELTTASKER